MRIKEGFVLRTVQKDHVVVGEGLAQVDFNKLLTLNSTAAFLWEKAVGRVFTVRELADALLECYDVTEDMALEDAAAWAKTLKEQGIIDE